MPLSLDSIDIMGPRTMHEELIKLMVKVEELVARIEKLERQMLVTEHTLATFLTIESAATKYAKADSPE